MTILEDRLAAALAARADLVQPEDLTREPPLSSRRSLLRRPTIYLLAAAACAAAAAVPFVVSGEGSDRPAPPAVPQTPQLPPPADVEGADWPKVGGHDGYDVDGDGEDDRVVVRTESGDELTQDPWRVEARLSSGGVYAILLDGSGWEINPIGPVDLDGDGGDEILYYNGLETAEIGVLDLVGPVLVDLDVPDEPGISSQPDGEGRVRAWWREQRALYSTRSVQGGVVPGDDGGAQLPMRYPVDVWRWGLVDGALVAEDQGRQCVEPAAGNDPFVCDVDSVTSLPTFYPAATEAAGVGETAQLTWQMGQSAMSVTLAGPAGEVARDGDVELQVTVDENAYAAPVPAGPAPTVLTTLMAADVPAVVLRQGTNDPSYTVYAVRDGRLELLQPGPGSVASLRGGDESPAGTPYESWLSADGELFTRADLDAEPGGAFAVFRWELSAQGDLLAERVETADGEDGEDGVCFDLAADPVLWTTC